MFLIADSGSTKSHWEIITPGTPKSRPVFTSGINPFYQSEQDVATKLKKELLPELSSASPEAIYFYGAGCSQPNRKLIVANALRALFPKAIIEVEHDLLAAARATCGNHPGITAILGTGSNSCLFDGVRILDNIPSLGFILGDEGSAGHFGRKLLQAYFYRELPGGLKRKMEADFNMDRSYVLNDIYDSQNKNERTASYAIFLSQNNTQPYVIDLLKAGFREFLERQVLKYKDAGNYPVHFIGSMAYNNQEILKSVLSEKNLKAGRMLKSPMEGLIKYHRKAQKDK